MLSKVFNRRWPLCLRTRVYECHFWERGFSKQDLLTNHIDRTHDRPHPFQHCDQKFSTKEDLQLHIPVHTRQSCPYCSQVFPLRNELLKHVAHAHADEDLSESNAKCWPEFAYHVHVRDGNAKISYQYFKGSSFDPFHLLPFKGKLWSSVHVVLFHVCYYEITHLIIKRTFWKDLFFNFGIEALVT